MVNTGSLSNGIFARAFTVFLYSNCVTRVISRQKKTYTSRSQASASDSSEGSVEGQYNFAAEDDEIDEGMFAGDRNSGSYLQNPGLRYLDPTQLNHDTPSFLERSVDDVIRLENYKPRISPSASRKNGATVYIDVENSNDSKGTEDLNDLSKGSERVTKPGPSSDDLLNSEPPNWVPPPPPVNMKELPVYSQEDESRRTSPDKLVGGSDETNKYWPSADGPSSSEGPSEDGYITLRETEPSQCPQGDHSAKMKSESIAQDNSVDSAKKELLADRSSFHSEDTSEDDDTMDWPPPPPPPQKSSYQSDDSDWERPLPPEIIALPGKRNRVASWARDEAEGLNDFDDLTKI